MSGLEQRMFGFQHAARPINPWWADRGRLETARTGITEKRLEPARTHKTLRLDSRPNTNEPEKPPAQRAQRAQTPESRQATIPCVRGIGERSEGASANCANRRKC